MLPVLAMEVLSARWPTWVDNHIRDLIRRMRFENPLWGAPRIHGELLKLGIEVHSGHRVSTEAQSVSGRFEAFVYREEDIQQVTVYQNGDRNGAVGPWAFHQFQID